MNKKERTDMMKEIIELIRKPENMMTHIYSQTIQLVKTRI